MAQKEQVVLDCDAIHDQLDKIEKWSQKLRKTDRLSDQEAARQRRLVEQAQRLLSEAAAGNGVPQRKGVDDYGGSAFGETESDSDSDDSDASRRSDGRPARKPYFCQPFLEERVFGCLKIQFDAEGALSTTRRLARSPYS